MMGRSKGTRTWKQCTVCHNQASTAIFIAIVTDGSAAERLRCSSKAVHYCVPCLRTLATTAQHGKSYRHAVIEAVNKLEEKWVKSHSDRSSAKRAEK